jgi:hypothetical protein
MPSASTIGRAWGQRRGGLCNVLEHHGLARNSDAADDTLADRDEKVSRAEALRKAAVSAQVQREPVGRHEVEAGDLMSSHMGQRVQRDVEDVLDIERLAQRGGHSVQNCEMPT